MTHFSDIASVVFDGSCGIGHVIDSESTRGMTRDLARTGLAQHSLLCKGVRFTDT